MSTNNSYKSKWGFHPVSRETFLKIRELKKFYFITLHRLGTWVRWDRKTVNQHGPEPIYCPMFVEDKMEWRKHVNKEGFTEYRTYPKTRVDHGILEAYESARMPKATAEEVVPLKISEEEINRLYDQMNAWILENFTKKVEDKKSIEKSGLFGKVAAFLKLQ